MAGIYVHIPFCVRKCLYCDFVSYADPAGPARYVPALKKEILLAAGHREDLPFFDTVFLGGGTPSLLTGQQVGEILNALFRAFRIDPCAEITIECNPGTANAKKLSAWRAAGVNRLSIGLQSADDRILKRIGRIHTFSDFLTTLKDARSAGFQNINADVMHGLPGQSAESYLSTLRIAADEEIPHISSYSLILESGTPLYTLVMRGDVRLPGEEETADMEDAGIAYLRSRGYERYEISNFCLPGYECRHNLNYWENGIYLGLGAAAHGCLGSGTVRTRYSNLISPDGYEAAVANGTLPIGEIREIPPDEQMFETVMLGLRTSRGIDLSGFRSRFGIPLCERYPDAVEALRKRGWLRESETSLALNDRGMDMNNAAIRLFMEP